MTKVSNTSQASFCLSISKEHAVLAVTWDGARVLAVTWDGVIVLAVI